MLNETQIVGNVGRDAELKYTAAGVAVLTFSVAVNKTFKVNGEKRKKTSWFKVTIWREYGELMAQYIKKGTQIFVKGEVSASAYIDKKTNEPTASLEITAEKIILLGSNDNRANGDAGGDEYEPAGVGNDEDVPF